MALSIDTFSLNKLLDSFDQETKILETHYQAQLTQKKIHPDVVKKRLKMRKARRKVLESVKRFNSTEIHSTQIGLFK